MVSRDGQTEESKMRLKRFAEILQAKADGGPGAVLHAMNEAGLFGLERTIAQQAVERDKVHTLLTQK
ncbi:MAG: hypothetical protein ABI791_07525 [Acidobacteriota bacterium]